MSRHIHFIGIGGIGMSGIAQLLLLKGEKITGSDIKENANTKILEESGAKVYIGHEPQNIKDADLVIYSSAIDSRNAELNYAIESQIPVLKRAEILSQLMSDKISITVSGAHGKTTTTSMISHLLTNAGLCPTVVAGGIVQNYSKNSWLGEGKYFVAELDESDGSFLYFHPHISVVTNIDYEHVDYYGNWPNILNAFRKFLNQTKEDGLIIACGDDKNLLDILKPFGRRNITYGISVNNEVYAKDIIMKNLFSNFRCVYRGNDLGEVSLNIPGSHNISNALACICVGQELGIDFAKSAKILSEFRGVQRRFQIKARIKGITIVEDYGHHPTEIAATLKAAKTVDSKRLVVVFQPHRYTRTKFLLKEFSKCFDLSDYLILTDIYAASEKPIPGVSAQNLFEIINASGRGNVFFIARNNITEHLLKVLKEGDLVLFLGAGDINRLSDELEESLKKNS
jgi:UDP-N-acetylmuramate--alanine ligase